MTLAHSATTISLQGQITEETMFDLVSQRPFLERVWEFVTKKAQKLMVLSEVVEPETFDGEYVGRQQIRLDEIKGCSMAGKQREFDGLFRPLNARSKNRWVSIAAARRKGKKMPPVQVIKYDGCYFVEDGHHRISVARAFGDVMIEAEIVAC